jgi:hypothetical protein
MPDKLSILPAADRLLKIEGRNDWEIANNQGKNKGLQAFPKRCSQEEKPVRRIHKQARFDWITPVQTTIYSYAL